MKAFLLLILLSFFQPVFAEETATEETEPQTEIVNPPPEIKEVEEKSEAGVTQKIPTQGPQNSLPTSNVGLFDNTNAPSDSNSSSGSHAGH